MKSETSILDEEGVVAGINPEFMRFATPSGTPPTIAKLHRSQPGFLSKRVPLIL
jgi:hypothetical protein